jgi:four helix bundle protein
MLKAKTYSFERLDVWQRSRQMTKHIYRLTSTFPATERFGLIAQIRRAAISVSSCIAEGTSRESMKDQARFSEIAFGSLIEVLNQSIISADLGYIAPGELESLRQDIDQIAIRLDRLRKSQLNR